MERFGFRRMPVYQLALGLVETLYRETRHLPAEARPIVWQLLRSSVSIGLNIAEGAGEFRRPEKARFYRVARRSTWEVVAALDMLRVTGSLNNAEVNRAEATLDEISAMLTGLIKYQENEHARSLPKPRNKTKPSN
jgi:four helix bundle protein